MSRKMQALYVKVFEKMQELVPQFSPSSTMAVHKLGLTDE